MEITQLEGRLSDLSTRVHGIAQKMGACEGDTSSLAERLDCIENGIVRDQVALQTKINKCGEEIDSLKQESRRRRGPSDEVAASHEKVDSTLALQLQEFWATEQETLKKEVDRDLAKLQEGLANIANKNDERATTLTEGLSLIHI